MSYANLIFLQFTSDSPGSRMQNILLRLHAAIPCIVLLHGSTVYLQHVTSCSTIFFLDHIIQLMEKRVSLFFQG